jgi:hypothetical protein
LPVLATNVLAVGAATKVENDTQKDEADDSNDLDNTQNELNFAIALGRM